MLAANVEQTVCRNLKETGMHADRLGPERKCYMLLLLMSNMEEKKNRNIL